MMELLQAASPLTELYASLPDPVGFTLLDVGCSGGIDPVFLRLGEGFRALGIDASVDEIQRLNGHASDSRVRYIDAMLGLPPDHPFMKLLGDSPYCRNSPMSRTSVMKTIGIRSARENYQTHDEKMKDNIWFKTRLSENHTTILDAAESHGFSDIDLLKIDIDGPDFAALQILDGQFAESGILAVVMEVNYNGDIHPAGHAFHNTDRFMRKNGFDLFGLTVRPYSMAALPFRFQYDVPAQTFGGRPIQGDALYVRDVCAGSGAECLDIRKALNLLLIHSLFGLPDCAAEIILRYRDMLSARIDTVAWLDALTRQSMQLQSMDSSFAADYASLMEKYHNDSPDFYGALPGIEFSDEAELPADLKETSVLSLPAGELLSSLEMRSFGGSATLSAENNCVRMKTVRAEDSIRTPFFQLPASAKPKRGLSIVFEGVHPDLGDFSWRIVVQNQKLETLKKAIIPPPPSRRKGWLRDLNKKKYCCSYGCRHSDTPHSGSRGRVGEILCSFRGTVCFGVFVIQSGSQNCEECGMADVFITFYEIAEYPVCHV